MRGNESTVFHFLIIKIKILVKSFRISINRDRGTGPLCCLCYWLKIFHFSFTWNYSFLYSSPSCWFGYHRVNRQPWFLRNTVFTFYSWRTGVSPARIETGEKFSPTPWKLLWKMILTAKVFLEMKRNCLHFYVLVQLFLSALVLTGTIPTHMLHFLVAVLYFTSLQTRHLRRKKIIPLSVHGFGLEDESFFSGRMSRKLLYQG